MPIPEHRPGTVWLDQLQKAKVEGAIGNKPKITVQDLTERANDPNAPESALIPNSPRSVEACFRLGIDPVQLQFHPIVFYQNQGEAEDIARIRYERCEAVRQERIKSLIDCRKMLVDEGWMPPVAGGGTGSPGGGKLEKQDSSKRRSQSAMVEKERARLEVLKRRQEKELSQMVQYEVQRKELMDKQSAKVAEMEKRAAELVRQKQESDAAWMARQRDMELQKMREEKELEKEAKRLADERYRKDRELQRKREEEELRLKREAYTKEMERRKKAEDARKETEAILAAQAEEVRQRKLEMERRDAERLKRLQLEARQRSEMNMQKREKAELRIQSALSMNTELLQRKRSAFETREEANERRRRELDEIRRKEEESKRQEEERKERERQQKYSQAVEMEELRKMTFKQRAEEKERLLAELAARRKREADIKRVETEFQIKLRRDKVDSIQKTNLYHRHQLLEKIMSEYDRTRSLMQERQSLQEQRKMANMTASLHRQAVSQAMDQLRCSKQLDKLVGPGGSIDVNQLVKRPATAM